MSIRGFNRLIENGFFPAKGGGGGGTSQSTVRTVPDWAIPYVKTYWEQAYALWQADTLSVYTGDVTASQPQDEVDGIDGLANRGRYGDQVISKAIAYEDEVINGGFLAGSKAAFVAALALVTGNASASWSSINSRIGKKAYATWDPDPTLLAQKLVGSPRYGYTVDTVDVIYNSRMSALIYADNWRRERDIQNQGLGYGVEMGKHAAIDAEALRRAGAYQREYLQGSYELSHKLFVEGQEIAVANLELFGNAIRALTGSQQTTTQDMPGANKLMTAAGGAVAGAVAGFYLTGGNPIGAVVGGIVGGVIGWFG